MKQIKIKISNNGVVEAKTLGIKGKTCLKYLEKIEEMANAVAYDSSFTDEYYETDEVICVTKDEEVRFDG